MSSASQNGSSAEFRNAQLVVSDFDGTMFDTFEPSPGGIGVNEAYCLAIEQVFDHDTTALERYQEAGEHQNRTPTEIAASLAPSATPKGVKRLAEDLVHAKLDLLTDQIGQELSDGTAWPRPIPGFEEAWQEISAARTEQEPISTAVISAGHAEFITKCLESAGLELPDFMVTDETIRGLYSNLPLEKLTKPSPLSMEIVKAQWMSLYTTSEIEQKMLIAVHGIKHRIVYTGDDPIKDAQLAANAEVDFVLLTPDNPEEAWQRTLRMGLASVVIEGAIVNGRQ